MPIAPNDDLAASCADGAIEPGCGMAVRVVDEDHSFVTDLLDDGPGAVVAVAVGDDDVERARIVLIQGTANGPLDRPFFVAGGNHDRHGWPAGISHRGGERACMCVRILPRSRSTAEIIFTGELAFGPELLLAMWAAGTAAAAAAVAWWQIVGPGYTWLTGATVVAMGVGGGLLDPHPGTVLATVAALLAVGTARQRIPSTALFAIAAAGFGVAASSAGSIPLAVTGSVALGGITGEMLLGHWYLVSPQMPRWALRKLDLVAVIGLLLDALLLGLAGILGGAGGLGAWIFAMLGGVSILLMVAVWFALKESGYEGVMAATGLSYLAVLTSLGATAVGRVLLSGDSSFIPLG